MVKKKSKILISDKYASILAAHNLLSKFTSVAKLNKSLLKEENNLSRLVAVQGLRKKNSH